MTARSDRTRAVLAGYIRVSRVGDRGERLISPELQEEKIRAYAAARGVEVDVLESELDVSGGKLERPVLSEILEGVESGRFSGVIVAQLDRLSRLSLSDAHKVIERIESAGGEVIAVAENFDPSTPEGELARNMFLSLGRMQRRRHATQIAASKERAVRLGIWPLPVVPLGYRRGGDRRLEAHPEEAELIVRAFQMRAAPDSASWREIGRVIDRGNTGARRVVRNRVYLGEIHYGEWSNLEAHPPLVERSLYEAAQVDHPRPPRGKSGPALLAGILRCTGCRGLLTPDTRAYRCQPGNRAAGDCPAPALIAKSIIEPYVAEVVLGHLAQLRFVGAAPVSDSRAAAEALEVAERERCAYQQATEVATVGVENFAEGMRLRVERVEEARRRLGEARASLSPALDITLGDLWEELSVPERRHLLAASVGVVWVRKGRGPAAWRVKVMLDTPAGLPAKGWGRDPINPLAWGDLTDWLEPPSAHDLREGLRASAT